MLKLILVLHVIGGSAALLAMGIPLVSRKGGRLHRRAGWVFVAGMAVVSLTALLLSGHRFLFDTNPSARRVGLFLFYVGVLTAATVSAGVRAPGAKHRTGPHLHVWDVGIAALLTLGAAGMAAYGIISGVPLFFYYAITGAIVGGGQLRYWLRPPNGGMHWWFEHMRSMLGASIAAVTAFLVINAGNIGLPRQSLIVWLAPTVVGVPLMIVWVRHYRRKFAGRSTPRADAIISPASPRDTSRSVPAAVPYMPSRIA
jgi:hypothetical protein